MNTILKECTAKLSTIPKEDALLLVLLLLRHYGRMVFGNDDFAKDVSKHFTKRVTAKFAALDADLGFGEDEP